MSNSEDGDFKTKYGVIHARNPGPFVRYPNVNTYVQNKSGTRYVQLQGPALRAFKAAEARVATKRKPHILITGHGFRDYQTQKDLYDSDHQRYADPDLSNHVEAIAVDVDQSQGRWRLRKVNKALKVEGFVFTVPGEPWHGSFRLTG